MNYTRLTSHNIEKITISKLDKNDSYNARTITIHGRNDDGQLTEALEITLFSDEIDNLKVNL